MRARGGGRKRGGGGTQCVPAGVVCRGSIMVLLVILNLNHLCKLPQQGLGFIKVRHWSTVRNTHHLTPPFPAAPSRQEVPLAAPRQVCSSRAHIPQRGRRRPPSQRVTDGGNEEITQTDFFFYCNQKLRYTSNYLINVQKMN